LFEPIDLTVNEWNEEMKGMLMPPSGQLSPATRRQKGESPHSFRSDNGSQQSCRWKWKFRPLNWQVKMCQKVIHSTQSNQICSNTFHRIPIVEIHQIQFVLRARKIGPIRERFRCVKVDALLVKKNLIPIFVLWGHLSGLFITDPPFTSDRFVIFQRKYFIITLHAVSIPNEWKIHSSYVAQTRQVPPGGLERTTGAGWSNQGQTGRRNENEGKILFHPMMISDQMKYSSKKGLQQFQVFSRTWNTWPARHLLTQGLTEC
jgi:hypothetical protein